MWKKMREKSRMTPEFEAEPWKKMELPLAEPGKLCF